MKKKSQSLSVSQKAPLERGFLFDPAKALQIGRVYREHGVRGFFKAHIYSGADDNLRLGQNYWLVQGDSTIETHLTDISHVGQYFLLKFDAFKNPESIVMWRKAGIWLNRTDLKREANEKYDFEWEGFVIFDLAQDPVGPVEGVVYTPKKNFSVRLQTGETALIPFEKSWIQSLDEKAKRIVMDLPEGLI